MIGKMVNQFKKPYAIVLNRGVQGCQMVVVGPNRIYFDRTSGDEFKVLVPCGYANMPANLHPLLTIQPIVEVYCVDKSESSVKFANEMGPYDNCADLGHDPKLMQGISFAS